MIYVRPHSRRLATGKIVSVRSFMRHRPIFRVGGPKPSP